MQDLSLPLMAPVADIYVWYVADDNGRFSGLNQNMDTVLFAVFEDLMNLLVGHLVNL